jgi:hypothetical protein
MARGRMLNKSVCASLKFHDLPDDTCRLMATWTISLLDVRGVFYGDPAMVKSAVFPRRADVTIEQIGHYLEAMQALGLIVIFRAKGDLWQWWPGFPENQVGLRTDRESTDFPPPPDAIPQDGGNPPEGIPQDDGEFPPEMNLREGKEKGKARDYLDDVLAGQGEAGIASPTEDGDMWLEYRDKAISSYHKLTKIKPNEVAKGAIGNLAGETGFDLQKWRESIQSCLLNGVKAGNVSCMIDTYWVGGNYQDLYARKNGGEEDSTIVVEDGKRIKVVK